MRKRCRLFMNGKGSSIHLILNVHSFDHWLLDHANVFTGRREIDLVVTGIDSVIRLIALDMWLYG